MKKLVSSILASTMILSMATVSFATENPTNTGDLKQIYTETLTSGTCGDNAIWSFDAGTGTLTVSGTGAMTEFESTTSLPWRSVKDQIQSVVISSGITSVGQYAFDSCKSITTLSLPQGLTSIGNSAFYKCEALTAVTFPDSLKTIGHTAFFGCVYIDSVSLPNSLTYLGGSAFWGAAIGETTLEIPSSLTEICDYTFADFAYNTKLTLPNSITTLGMSSFSGWDVLETVSIPNSVTTMKDSVFYNCTSLKSIFIPASVTEMGIRVLDKYTNFNTAPMTQVTVYGFASSYVESWCNEAGIAFSAVSSVPDWALYNNSTDPIVPATPEPEATPTSPTYSKWAESQVTYADENGLIVDSLGNNYTVDITRGQIADLLVNMIEKSSGETLPEADKNTFTDANVSSVLKAFEAGIILGKTTTTFQPDSTATRQEIAIMIVRAIEKLEELTGESYIDHSLTSLEDYSDFENTANWAKNFVAILANNNIMNGSDNKLNPLSATSIQECLILNNNLFKLGE